ncbi:MAG: hypothetical protein ABI315_03270 [Bacteroidia bacterium]
MAFQRRLSRAVFKPPDAALRGNYFCGERLGKTGTRIPVGAYIGAE